MSWSGLERLVHEAEADAGLRRSLKGCRSTPELILAARRLGYRITRMDLQRAWEEEREEYQREAQGSGSDPKCFGGLEPRRFGREWRLVSF